jgi:hypothetical protein
LVVGASEKMNAYHDQKYLDYPNRKGLVLGFLDILMRELKLDGVQPEPFLDPSKECSPFDLTSIKASGKKHLVSIISRTGTRKLLNEQQVLATCNTFQNVRCELVRLETMSLYEQMKYIRGVSMLIGVHGNGLTNTYWMTPGTVVLQMYPKLY